MPPDTGATATQARWRSYVLLAIVMLLWAGNSIVGRAVREDVPPFLLAFVRWTGASLIALPIAWRHLVEDRERLLVGWRPLLLLGLAGIASFNALLYSGLRYTTATNGLLVQAAIPAMVLVANWLIFRTRSGPAQIGGVAVSTAGVVYIVTRGAPAAIIHTGFNAGDLLILCAVLCWALYTSLLRIRPDCHPLSFLVTTFVIGIVAMAVLTLTELDEIGRMTLSWKVIGAFAYVSVLPSLVAYGLYNAAVRDLGAGRAGQTISLMPLFGSLLAALLLGEALQGYHMFGMALILTGIVLAALGR